MKRLLLSAVLFCTAINLIIGQNCQDGSAPVSMTLNLAGVNSAGDYGSVANSTGAIAFGSLHTIVGVEWVGVDINPVGASWCSEPELQLGSGLFLTFGFGEDNAGPCVSNYTSGGFLNLELLGLPPYETDASGDLLWEAAETFDDDDGSIVDQTYGNGIVTIYGCLGSQSLPVDLVSFKGLSMEDYNLLEWVTASEINSDLHVVEMSLDGRSKWQEVGRVTPKGNSSETQIYTLTHEKPSNLNYYRLKEISVDGKISFSEIISVERSTKGFSINRLFPNPAVNELFVEVDLDETISSVMASISDVNGKVIRRLNHNSEEGSTEFVFPVQDLSAGVYFLTVHGHNKSLISRFVKK